MTPLEKNLNIKVIESFDEAQQCWVAFEQEGDCYAFQNYNWLKTWYETVGVQSDITLCIVLVGFSAGKPLMLLPLGVEHAGFNSRLIWLGGAISDYHAPLLSADCSEKLNQQTFQFIWKSILAKLPSFDIIWFEKIPEFVQSQKNPFLYLSCYPNASSAHYSQLQGTFESFLKIHRSKKSINTEKRKQRRLKEQGEISFKLAKNEHEIARFLEEMMAQKARSYTEMGVSNLFRKPGYRAFFKRLTENHTKDGFVHLSALTLGDRLLATHWGVVYKNRFYHLLPTYERSELTKYSPGNLLLWNLLEWSFDHDVELYDFTVGDEAYKYHWSDKELLLYDFYQANTMRGLLSILPLKTMRILKRKIKHSPRLWTLAQWARSKLLNR